MQRISLRAYAKINLSLDILGKRQDGYHDLCMLMQSVSLHDKVSLTKIKKKDIELASNLSDLGDAEHNLAYKAAKLLYDEFDIKEGIHIDLYKCIPVGAGMGGGSADAAAVLRGVNKLFDLGITEEGLKKRALKLGADVPFCISGGTVLASGIGERLEYLKSLPEAKLVVLKPHISISTKEAYSLVDINYIEEEKRPDTGRLLKAIEAEDIDMLACNMKNVFEIFINKEYPVIDAIKEKLIELGASGAMMSGSGSAVFGIFSDEDKAYKAYEEFKYKSFIKLAKQAYICDIMNRWEV